MIAPLPAKRSLVDIAVEAIGDRLAEGVWPVGSRIPTEPELAELLGISRNTVREAVRVLLFAGLLEVRQGDGTYVRARVSPADAMRAKIQGSVWLECIVMPDGSVGEVKVTRSLDPIFGLDQEAIKAAKQWRFRPGMRQGAPVPVIITIELTFTLR